MAKLQMGLSFLKQVAFWMFDQLSGYQQENDVLYLMLNAPQTPYELLCYEYHNYGCHKYKTYC